MTDAYFYPTFTVNAGSPAPNVAAACRIKFTTGGVVGTNSLSYALSLDNGTTYGGPVSIGTATTFTVAALGGVVFLLAFASKIATNGYVSFQTVLPAVIRPVTSRVSNIEFSNLRMSGVGYTEFGLLGVSGAKFEDINCDEVVGCPVSSLECSIGCEDMRWIDCHTVRNWAVLYSSGPLYAFQTLKSKRLTFERPVALGFFWNFNFRLGSCDAVVNDAWIYAGNDTLNFSGTQTYGIDAMGINIIINGGFFANAWANLYSERSAILTCRDVTSYGGAYGFLADDGPGYDPGAIGGACRITSYGCNAYNFAAQGFGNIGLASFAADRCNAYPTGTVTTSFNVQGESIPAYLRDCLVYSNGGCAYSLSERVILDHCDAIPLNRTLAPTLTVAINANAIVTIQNMMGDLLDGRLMISAAAGSTTHLKDWTYGKYCNVQGRGQFVSAGNLHLICENIQINDSMSGVWGGAFAELTNTDIFELRGHNSIPTPFIDNNVACAKNYGVSTLTGTTPVNIPFAPFVLTDHDTSNKRTYDFQIINRTAASVLANTGQVVCTKTTGAATIFSTNAADDGIVEWRFN